MKKTFLFVFFACVITSSISCKKDDDPGPPETMTINKIEVTRFPFTDGGVSWDVLGDADIFPIISLDGTTLWESSKHIKNADPNSDHTFHPSPVIELTRPTRQYTIWLYDYDDFDANDYMGDIDFIPYQAGEGYPSVLTLDAGAGVAFKLHVSYSW